MIKYCENCETGIDTDGEFYTVYFDKYGDEIVLCDEYCLLEMLEDDGKVERR